MIRSKLAGVSFRPIAAQLRAKQLVDGEPLNLVPEPTNQFDPDAIKVETQDGVFIGYVQATKCAEVHAEWSAHRDVSAQWYDGGLDILTEDDLDPGDDYDSANGE